MSTVAQEEYVNSLIEYMTDVIPHGKDNAVTREELEERIGCTDREMRRMIADARKVGVFICNDQDGRGYYISDDLSELEKQYRQDRARALSILSRCKYIRRYLKSNGVEVK